jgi:two-component system, chemotaxis family, protein-glutamate methylesterase/glutaminase
MMGSAKVRVLVVDDSAFMRKVIQQILSEDPGIEIVGVARDGMEAIRIAKERSPDVITLDVEMPVMDGISCLEKLLVQDKYGVVMVSSLTTEGAAATIRALELGAVDFFPKPSNLFSISQEARKHELIDKVKVAGQAKSHLLPPVVSAKVAAAKPEKAGFRSESFKTLVALGISTGGPRALQSVIPNLPASLPAPVLLVQHMPPGFTRSLANRLNDISQIEVKEAQDGDVLKAGCVYIAPGDHHLDLTREGSRLIVRLDRNAPPMNGFRPSVDFLMDAVRKTGLREVIGVIMTGMGADGSRGLRDLKKENGAHIIAQDEKSCSVFGMPRAAIELGVVDEVVPLENIAASIARKTGV